MTIDTGFGERERQFMQVALELAERGRYTTMPNPRVGCVITQGDEIVGRGAHLRAGQQHAEVLALAEAGDKTRGATVFVTLEPCSFSGRTGPCTDALIDAGVARVVYALEDPNPKVAGQGGGLLRAAGIKVDCGLCAEQAQTVNRGFFQRMQRGMPFVQAKTAISLDGRTAMADGSSQWITGSASRQRVQQMRAQSCAIVTGVGTVLCDDPSMTVRKEQLGEDIGRQPVLVIVDSRLRTPLDAKVIRESIHNGRKVLIACSSVVDVAQMAEFSAMGIEVKVFSGASRDEVDLPALLKNLAARDCNEVFLEAGATLLGSFITQALVDELAVFVAPKLLGAAARPLADLNIDNMDDAITFKLLEVNQVGDDCLMRYQPVLNSLA